MLSAGQTKGNTCTLSYGQSDNCKTQAQVITIPTVVEGVKFSIYLSVFISPFVLSVQLFLNCFTEFLINFVVTYRKI